MAIKQPYPQDMRDALDVFCRKAQNLVVKWVKTLSEPAPLIYHHTNDVGLRGILETGQLWLTDIFKLNDPSEVYYGFSRAVDILKIKVASGPPECIRFADGLIAFVERNEIEKLGHYLICSFSSCGDDLGQWRAYGDDGRGYALGFDAEVLGDEYTSCGAQLENTESFPITYNDAELDRMLGRIIDLMLPLVSSPVGKHLDKISCLAYLADLCTWLTVYALRFSLFFKHYAYENEQEYRFLEFYGANMVPANVKLRGRPYSLIRYREFDWRRVGDKALREIVMGPAADRKKSSQFAKDCLRLSNARNVRIIFSAIPYRTVR
jgi:hypothetical protein